MEYGIVGSRVASEAIWLQVDRLDSEQGNPWPCVRGLWGVIEQVPSASASRYSEGYDGT